MNTKNNPYCKGTANKLFPPLHKEMYFEDSKILTLILT